MRYAFTQTDISPRFPIKAIGYALQTEPMETVRDPLTARLLYLEEGETRVLLIAADLIHCPRSTHERLQEALSRAWGREVTVILSCTHTHFGPDTTNPRYADFLQETLLTAALSLETREGDLSVSLRAEPFFGVGRSRISHWETEDIRAHVLALYERKKLLAALCLYNCHPTVQDGYTPYFTAEYPGRALRLLEAAHPGVFFAFLQGAAGDVSTRFTRSEQSYDEMERFGARMAEAFEALLARMPAPAPLTLETRENALPLTHALKDPKDLVIPDYYSERERFVLQYGIEAAARNLADPARLSKDMLIASLRLGPYALVFTEKELFSEYTRALDPARAALVCYAQGDGAYVAGPSFDGMTYESLQDTLTPDCRLALMDAIARAADFGKE